jgi:lysophospholipase L1-like esterase
MPVIVVFGDSNTWGYDPATGGRFSRAQRWPSVLQRELGSDFEVIAEGLNGRTTVHDDPIEPYRCGADALPPCLMSHAPVDLVVLALGCNDLKKRFSVSAFDIAEGAGRLIFLARAYGQGANGRPPKILLVAPPPIAKLTDYAEMFEGGQEKSILLAIATSRSAKALRSSTPARSFDVRISTASTTRSISMNCSAALWLRRFKERSPLLWFP